LLALTRKCLGPRCPIVANAPDKIAEGYKILAGEGKNSVSSVDAYCYTYLDSKADEIDPLLANKYEELEKWCRDNGIDLNEALKAKKAQADVAGQSCRYLLKTDLASLLRKIEFVPPLAPGHPDETIPAEDQLGRL
jgi:hypothetical protein